MKKRTKGRVKEFERSGTGKSSENYGQNRMTIQKKTGSAKKKKVKFNQGRLLLTAIVAVLIAVVGMSVKTVFDLRAEQAALKEANRDLASEKASLKEELKNVNDKEYIEEQARIQLKLIRPGEILYILEDQNADETKEKKDEEDH